MSLANEREDFALITSFLPGYRGWTYYEADKHIPIEEVVKHHGKWVIYGKKGFIEEFADRIRPEIDSAGPIDAIKYSDDIVAVTPDAPSECYALLVYCNDYDRNGVLSTLEGMGARDQAEQIVWKYDRESILEDFSNPRVCLVYALFNYDNFKRTAGMVGIGEDSDIMRFVDGYREMISDFGAKCKVVSDLMESGADEQTLMNNIDELFGEGVFQKLKDAGESEQSETL